MFLRGQLSLGSVKLISKVQLRLNLLVSSWVPRGLSHSHGGLAESDFVLFLLNNGDKRLPDWQHFQGLLPAIWGQLFRVV